MARSLVIGGRDVGPGTTELVQFKVAEHADGSPVWVPVICVNGSSDGPRLWLGALLHGPEMPGYEVVRQVARDRIHPKELRGSLVAVPIVNPLGFRASQMHTPEDGYNLNRLFPGVEDGFLGEQMARRIMDDLVSTCDYVVDLHANPHPAMAFTLTLAGDTRAHAESRDMAAAVGLTSIEMRLRSEHHRGGTLTESCVRRGKPAIAIELIGWRRIVPESTAIGVRGALNVMRSLGMIDGELEPQVGTPVVSGEFSRVEVNTLRGGIVVFLCDAGDEVRADQIIAVVKDGFGDVREEVRSPVDGYILAYPMVANQASTNGEAVAFIAYRV